ncbi:MAG: alpha-glucan family phosphorylase [Planctomycetales bacterium]|nr:alpha-glucan family phosphorylase [Planctomycetales bacterium]MBN8628054.1 alpha-glucan family phosphorylase [Planctomycetota bacterium]
MNPPTTAPEREMLLPIDEVSHLVSTNGNPGETLANITSLIQMRFAVDVCSLYLLDPSRTTLMLAATVGLRKDSVGRVRMDLREGLVGLTAEKMCAVHVEDAFNHPRFKYFPEAGEDLYHSFLGVPIVDRGALQGVLTVQTAEPRQFNADEVRLLTMTGSQVAPLVAEARALELFRVPSLERADELASNLWWSWDVDSTNIYRELDPVRWRELVHNPIELLQEIPINVFQQRADERVLHSRINYAYRRMHEYLSAGKTWSSANAGILKARPVAYFSAEFGIHESVPIYSGGLGILAGDHVKSASDLGVPLVGIGLFYDQGYFRQRLDMDGLQQEDYLDVDPGKLPLVPAIVADGKQLVVSIDTRSGPIHARVWKLTVGRNTLVLLDSDVEGNQPEDRELTSRLYGGDTRVRIRQELLLGVGGYRAIRALGIQPGVLHLNEGHSAFASLEVIRRRMQQEGIAFDEAARRVSSQICFTTHTPVPAGHDRFTADQIEEHLGPLRDELGISHDQLMGLGRVDPYNPHEEFCMTVIALKLSRRANAVSSLHGEVSRSMWTSLYPGRPAEEVPIGHITNGVHVLSWLAPQMQQLYDRHLGPTWQKHSGESGVWEDVEKIEDGEFWETHITLKARMLDFVRRRAARQAERRHEPPEHIAQLKRALSMDALTIGFARRFATYKRADLLFQDIDRVAELIGDPRRPVQFVFAGKAHPHDRPGKGILQKIAQLARDPRFAGRLVFVEDYDINTCRHFVQGVDVWLNNPRRPLEASGTSGQKVILNGGLNLSILDGWWAEAYDGSNGFAIGDGYTHSDTGIHDKRDGESLFETLKNEVIPLYYDRDRDGLPRAWIKRMKRAVSTLGWRFSSDRMVMDYVKQCYVPAAGGTSSDMSRSRS